jgi:hypothetical protein
MKETRKKKLLIALDGIAMYFFTLIGVMVIKYLPMFKEGKEFEICFSWGRFIVGCVVAFMLLTGAERAGGRDTSGKKVNFVRRAVSAVAYGSLAHSLIGG